MENSPIDSSTRIAQDKAHVWHPFTQMRDWCAPDHEPLMIVRGEGAYLVDQLGKRYLDGNSSIWTNIHGHGHPAIISAIQGQAATLAHSSALGFGNEPAAELAAALVGCFPKETLTKVFYTDDGSTAIECALRLALQYWEMEGQPERASFAAFDSAYHGDTMGAAALGGIATFHKRVSKLGVPVCHVKDLTHLIGLPPEEVSKLAAVVIEPLIQGAAGMRLWPKGMLSELRAWCDEHGVFLILDEVMTGFGRTGKMFACQHEEVIPDFIALAKGLTGGTLPLAATLTTQRVFDAFLSRPGEDRTFYYGHSYCGNPLGCTAALASLQIFEEEAVLAKLTNKMEVLGSLLREWQNADRRVRDVRQCGFIAGIDIGDPSGAAFSSGDKFGAQVCLAARAHGLLTRPVNDTLVLMLPLCADLDDIRLAVAALQAGLRDVVPVE
ncbi:MAG: adenosylmethionine--8-amino-7-oxononanoate transaminase [Verrucomicrobiales bacterium]